MSDNKKATRSNFVPTHRFRRTPHANEFDVDSDTWRLRSHGNRESIRIPTISSFVDPRLYESIKFVFSVLAETRPAGSAAMMFDRFRSFLRLISRNGDSIVFDIDAEQLAIWISQGQTGTSLSYMRSVLGLWSTLRVPGLTQDARDLIVKVSNPKDPVQLSSVISWDPSEGPYRPADDEAIKLALDAAFNGGHIKILNYALLRFFRGTGARPDQVAAMKVGDIQNISDRWHVRIPHAKQGNSDWRTSFMPWKPVSQGFANTLLLYIESDVRPRVAIDAHLDDCPLFPSRIEATLSVALSCHARPKFMTQVYKETMNLIEAISPITGEAISGTPKRDRHTFLTHLAMNGCTAEEIAANAGQAKVASCTPYVHASIDHFQRMESYLGASFVPIADRFVGKVVSQEDDAHADDAIIDRSTSGVGSCSGGGCNAIETGAAPFSCYSCRKFRAWADAPHGDLLEHLFSEQERLRSLGHDAIAETTTSTIIAISDLLERIRLERSHG